MAPGLRRSPRLQKAAKLTSSSASTRVSKSKRKNKSNDRKATSSLRKKRRSDLIEDEYMKIFCRKVKFSWPEIKPRTSTSECANKKIVGILKKRGVTDKAKVESILYQPVAYPPEFSEKIERLFALWITESLRPLSIVEDEGLRQLMDFVALLGTFGGRLNTILPQAAPYPPYILDFVLELVASWIVTSKRPISIVEDKGFQRLLDYLVEAAGGSFRLIAPSREAVSEEISKRFPEYKQQTEEVLDD